MALIFTDGFDHYGNADVLTKWTSGTAFRLQPGAGRLGSAGAVIDGDLQTACRVDLTIGTGGAATFLTTTLGFALRPLVMPAAGSALIVASWPCSDPLYEAIYLLLDGDGRLELRRGPGNPLTDTDLGHRLCRTAAGAIDAEAIAGTDEPPYVEIMLRLDDWTQEIVTTGSVCLFGTQIRIGGVERARAATQYRAALQASATPQVLLNGATRPAIGTVWSGLVLGDARNPRTAPAVAIPPTPATTAARIAIGDLYVLNSDLPRHTTETTYAVSPTIVGAWTNPIPPRRVIDYRSFLGDTKIDLALPQARAYGGGPSTAPPFPSAGYVPWTLTGGATIEAVLGRRVPDDAIYTEATAVGQIDAVQYLLQALAPFWPAKLPAPGAAAFDGTGIAGLSGDDTTGIQYSSVLEIPIMAVMRWLRVRRTGATVTLKVTQQLPLGMDTNWAAGPPATVASWTQVEIPAAFAYRGLVQYAPYPPGAIYPFSPFGTLGPGGFPLHDEALYAGTGATNWDFWKGHPRPGATWALRYFFPTPAPHYSGSATEWPPPIFGARVASPPTFSPPNPSNAYLSLIEFGMKVTAI